MNKSLAGAVLTLSCLALAIPALANNGVDLEHHSGGITSNQTERNGHASYTVGEAKTALAKLPASQASEFKVVHQALGHHKAAQTQLEALLAKHRLKYADALGHTVLDNLATIATKQLNHSLDRGQLLADVIADVCRPATIEQADHNTCSATSIQAALARSKPAEYARLVAGLATAGSVDVPASHTKLSSSIFIAFKDRTLSSNLMQPAIMDVEARVEGGHYDNKSDKIVPAKGRAHAGAYDEDVSAAESKLLGGKYVTLDVTPKNIERAMAIVAKASAKNPVLCGLNMSDGSGHEVQVTGMKKDHSMVEIRNPWGERDYIPVQKFKKAVDGINYRAE